jgi:hypothetical protein
LLITTKAKKPDINGTEMAVFQSLLKPINEALVAVTELKEANRPDPKYHHLSTVSDGIMLLAWVTVDNRPHKHIEECLNSAQFFGNRVQKEYKDKCVHAPRPSGGFHVVANILQSPEIPSKSSGCSPFTRYSAILANL